LELAKQDGCPNGRAFPGMHLAGQERLYYLIVGPCVITDDRGVPIRIGPAPSATPAVRMTIRSKRVQVLLDPSYGLGHLSGDRMKDSKPGLLTLGSTLAHENGHECGHQDASVLAELESNQCAIDAENRFNQAHGVDSIRQTH
jgi:hypothetical protein